jgi:exonuclease III
MKVITWNIKGLNGCSKQKRLWELIIAEQPEVLFLQETKCSSEDIDKLIPKCSKQGESMSIDATGTASGTDYYVEHQCNNHGELLVY